MIIDSLLDYIYTLGIRLKSIVMKLPLYLQALSIIGLLLACQIPGTNEATEEPDPIHIKLDSLGQAILNQGEHLGFSIAILQAKDTLYHQGFGFTDLARTQPVTHETRFRMASISKLIGTTLVMKLKEEGKLSLDQTLFELLPDFPNPDQAKKITLRHMLSHTSGLPEYSEVIDTIYLKTGNAPTKADFYQFFNDHELLFEPGTNYNYCNSGFLLMGMIVENTTGKSLQEEFDRVINKPAGLSLKLIGEIKNDPNMSPYFEPRDSSFEQTLPWDWFKGDGGLTANSAMLANFPRLWASGKIISQSSFEEMTHPMTLNDGIQMGYGLGVRNGEFFGEKIIGHTGGHKTTLAIMVYFPERDLTFVVFINTDAVPTSARNIFGMVASSFFGHGEPDFSDQEVPHDNLAMYAGSYRTYDLKSEQQALIELKEDKKLYYCYRDECYPMTYLGNHTFWIAQWPYDHVIFHVNEEGESLAIKEYFTGFYTILRKKIIN